MNDDVKVVKEDYNNFPDNIKLHDIINFVPTHFTKDSISTVIKGWCNGQPVTCYAPKNFVNKEKINILKARVNIIRQICDSDVHHAYCTLIK